MRYNKNSTPIGNLESILLKMKYDSKKTLSENKAAVEEQINIGFNPALTMRPYVPDLTPPEFDPTEYPNYCKYPDMAVDVDETEALGFQGYCRYARPEQKVNKSDKVGIWIPQEATIEFWSPESWKTTSNYIAEKWTGKHPWAGKEKKSYRDKVFNNLRNIFPIDTVHSFKIPGDVEKYIPILTMNEDGTWYFKGYYLGGFGGPGPWYEEPEDSRNAYEKFADNFSWWKQIIAFVGLAVVTRGLSSRFGMTQAQAYITEVLFSLAMGGVVGVREFQKGQNVAGVLSFILAAVPALRGIPAFRNVKPEVYNSLVDDLSKATLETSDDVTRFYTELAESGPLGLEKQRLFTQIFNGGDDLTKELIEKSLKELVENPTSLVKLAARTVGQSPEQFWRITFLKSVFGKELGWAGLITLLGLGAELFLGRQLNDEEKTILESVYRTIPESHKKEFEYNLANHPEKIPEVVETFKNEVLPSKGKQFDENIGKAVNIHMKDIIGDDYIELEEDPVKGDSTEIEDTPENIKKYIDLGYKQFKDFSSDEKVSNETIFIGTKLFIKPIKKN
jgi:hypothetical protein